MRRSLKAFLCVSLFQTWVALVSPAISFAQERPLISLRPDFGAREAPPVSATRVATVSGPQTAGGQRTTAPRPQSNAYFGWEIDFHTGMSWSNAPGGTTTLPQAGSSFPMFNGATTRSVRSWYFGDGSALLKQTDPVARPVIQPG